MIRAVINDSTLPIDDEFEDNKNIWTVFGLTEESLDTGWFRPDGECPDFHMRELVGKMRTKKGFSGGCMGLASLHLNRDENTGEWYASVSVGSIQGVEKKDDGYRIVHFKATNKQWDYCYVKSVNFVAPFKHRQAAIDWTEQYVNHWLTEGSRP